MKRITYWAKVVLVTAILGFLCGWFFLGCGHHHRSRVIAINSGKGIVGDEFIGTLEICWPDGWTDEEKAAARLGILAHLNAWEAEFKITVNPVKLILLSSYEPGSNLYDQDIILIYPGHCYEFDGLFILLTHCSLDDPEELDPRWCCRGESGSAVVANLKKLCKAKHHEDGHGHH